MKSILIQKNPVTLLTNLTMFSFLEYVTQHKGISDRISDKSFTEMDHLCDTQQI